MGEMPRVNLSPHFRIDTMRSRLFNLPVAWMCCLIFTLFPVHKSNGTTGEQWNYFPTSLFDRTLSSGAPEESAPTSINSDSTGRHSHIRIHSLKLPFDTDTAVHIRYAFHDASGVVVLDPLQGNSECSLQVRLLDGTAPSNLWAGAIQSEVSTGVEHLRIALCIDGSIGTAHYKDEIAAAVEHVTAYLDAKDRLALTIARAVPELICPMSTPDSVSYHTIAKDKFEGYGISRLSYGCLWTLHTLKPNVLVVMTGSDDYALFDIMPSDLLKQARDQNTSIWCIALGDRVISAPWEFLALFTGGRFYRTESRNSPRSLDSTLAEIFRSIKFTTRATVALPATIAHRVRAGCTIIVRCPLNDSHQTDSIVVPPEYEVALPRQIVTLFERESSSVDSIYEPLLDALAAVLNVNSSHVIELIGHSYGEGNSEQERYLAAERARAVAAALRTRGVQPHQLRLRAVGDLLPIYPIANTAQEFQLNRRVEFRWLDPQLLPYELVTTYVWSETEALTELRRWQDRGFNAYIEEVMIEQRPAFRIKLWGYATRQQAEAAARTITQRYKARVTIE